MSLPAVGTWNPRQRVTNHAIGIGGDPLLRRLVRENGGEYKKF